MTSDFDIILVLGAAVCSRAVKIGRRVFFFVVSCVMFTYDRGGWWFDSRRPLIPPLHTFPIPATRPLPPSCCCCTLALEREKERVPWRPVDLGRVDSTLGRMESLKEQMAGWPQFSYVQVRMLMHRPIDVHTAVGSLDDGMDE